MIHSVNNIWLSLIFEVAYFNIFIRQHMYEKHFLVSVFERILKFYSLIIFHFTLSHLKELDELLKGECNGWQPGECMVISLHHFFLDSSHVTSIRRNTCLAICLSQMSLLRSISHFPL